MRCARVINGVVDNVVEAGEVPEGWVPCGNAAPGWLQRAGGDFVPPVVVELRQVSRKAFLSRFTDDEAVDIDLASIGATREAATVRRYLSKTNAAQHIDLADEETREGVQALEAVGLIAAGRALEILDSPIQPKELP
ncbi:hypothetical protein [Acidovorax sp. Leaf160]|uniref:hypothetical protein n=1 Tax=Acidovorax sp. Leaf160 TaxID=1736280 RepID=UPI000B2BEAE4|nr:hypothetical protein [Acidovorax sp. Leaf160]